MPESASIVVDVSPHQYGALLRAAASCGLELEDFVRMAALRRADYRPHEGRPARERAGNSLVAIVSEKPV